MNEFTYVIYDDYDKFSFDSLCVSDCNWLDRMGLNETRWILDRAWFLYHDKQLTFEEWFKEKNK